MARSNATTRAVLLGHLTITIPALAFVPLVLYWGLNQFGPFLWPYYVSAGLGIAWQWYSVTLCEWEKFLRRKGVPDKDTEELARRSALIWPRAASVGSIALHTTVAAVCAIFLGPWLLSRWFVWILPLLGVPSTPSANDWLQHLELVSVIPALVVGYLVAHYFEELAIWAWILPTIILSYKLLTFTDPHTSVLASKPFSRFSYYFAIERSMPSFYNFAGTARFVVQTAFVAPFYSGIAYSLGALMLRCQVVERIIWSFRAEPEPVVSPEEAGVEWVGDDREQPAREVK